MAYFDNNATTPLHPDARQALLDASTENWANPSSPYLISAKVRASMQKCRESIASYLGTDPDQITFTSGSTEANNSVFSNLARTADPSSRVLLSPYEHPSVTEAAHLWFSDRVDILTAQSDGTISTDDLEAYLSKGLCLRLFRSLPRVMNRGSFSHGGKPPAFVRSTEYLTIVTAPNFRERRT